MRLYKRDMKVLVVCTVTFGLNGITSVILNYYKHLDLGQIQMDFLVTNKPSDQIKSKLNDGQSEIYIIPRSESPFFYILKLYKLCRKNHYDIIHVHGNSATMVSETIPAMLAGVPVRIAHSHNIGCTHMRLHKIIYPLFSATYTHALACGEKAGKWLFHEKEFVVLKNGIDLEAYKLNERIRKKYREKIHVGDKIVIGHVGEFNEQKNHRYLIELFSRLIQRSDKYVLLMIGDGPLFQDMKMMVNNLGLREQVLFLGRTEEVSQYMQAMDLFLLPSLYEGVPLVLIEAQASGLPCLVADSVSRETDLTGTVQYIDLNNQEEWIEQIISLEDSSMRIHSDNIGKLRQCGYDINMSSHMLADYYRQCLEE